MVHRYWEETAVSKPGGNLVTHPDRNQVSIEMNIISSLLKPSDVVLDIGCGTGFSSSRYSENCLRITGMDYSENMVARARAASKKKNLNYIVGDIRNMPEQKERFTAVISTRCLINLAGWGEQRRAIENIARLLPRGGRFIMAEGLAQGRKNLNKLRVVMGLKPMPKVWHNVDLDEKKLFPLLRKYFMIKNDIRFGVYDVLVRVFYPASIYPRKPKYGTRFQDAAERFYSAASGKDLFKEYCREAIFELIKK